MVTSGNILINLARAKTIQDKQESMSTASLRLSEKRRMKGLKVLELFDQGYSYRKIAQLVHISLRDVSKFINLAADKNRTPSTTSIHDLIILEYRVSNYRQELRDLKLEKEDLKNEVNYLRAQKYDLLNQLRWRQSELDAMKWNLKYEKFSREFLNGIFTEDQYHIL